MCGRYSETQELAKLQDDTIRLAPDVIEETISSELGAAPTDVFAGFDPEPLAAEAFLRAVSSPGAQLFLADGHWLSVRRGTRVPAVLRQV